MTLRLAEAFHTEADFWLRLQMQRDLREASQKKRTKVKPLSVRAAAYIYAPACHVVSAHRKRVILRRSPPRPTKNPDDVGSVFSFGILWILHFGRSPQRTSFIQNDSL